MQRQRVVKYVIMGALAAALTAANGLAQDGQHDFDFETGHWHIHLKQRQHPLTGSNTWVEFDGTSVTRPIWNGLGDIEEFETAGPNGHRIEGLTLRTFNPETQQWRLYWANGKNGIVVPPQIGQFKNGVGEFYASDSLNGKLIFIRFIWSKTNTDRPHFEQSFSDDGGKTWEVNWITDQTRVSDGPDAPAAVAAADHNHDFDFLFGTRRYHLKRLQNSTWVEGAGTSIGRQIWGGRADLTETHAEGSGGHLMGLTLRTYNPETHQWYLYWANSRDGIVSYPQVGQFKNGIGEFYATDSGTLVKYTWTNTTSASPHFEQAISQDGGKTWEVNWISEIESGR
jgi:BNR/Asp-box repeat